MLHHALTRQHADKSTVMTISQSLYCSGQIYAGYCISTFCIEYSKNPEPVVQIFPLCKVNLQKKFVTINIFKDFGHAS